MLKAHYALNRHGITDPTVPHAVFNPVAECNACPFQGRKFCYVKNCHHWKFSSTDLYCSQMYNATTFSFTNLNSKSVVVSAKGVFWETSFGRMHTVLGITAVRTILVYRHFYIIEDSLSAFVNGSLLSFIT